jgi:hypothetical protein
MSRGYSWLHLTKSLLSDPHNSRFLLLQPERLGCRKGSIFLLYASVAIEVGGLQAGAA